MSKTRLESAVEWVRFAYEGWRGRPVSPPDSPLPDRDIRQLGIGGFLHRALRGCGDARAADFAAEYRHTATANLLRLSQGSRIRDALAARSIPAVVLKGGAFLVRFAHDDLGVRPMADLDLLVAPEHRDAAAAALRSCGLQDTVHHRRSQDTAHATSFTSSSGPIAFDIDLHRALAQWPVATSLAPRILAQHDLVEGWRVPRLEDAFCVIALHRARHGFLWSATDLFEFKRMAEEMTDADWAAMVVRARATDLTGALWAGWRLMSSWLGASGRDHERLADFAGQTAAPRRTILARMTPIEIVLAPDVRWSRPLFRTLVVGPLAMTTPGRALLAALLFLPLRAAEEWATARQQGLGSTATLKWLWQYTWRGADVSRASGRPESS